MSLLFVFDMDDVLYDYDWRHRMAGLTALTGMDLGELRSRWWTIEHGEWAAEAGHYADGEAYLEAFNAALGIDLDRETWLANRGGAMRPRADAIAAVEYAARHGRVSLLTNNNPLVGENLATVAPELVPHVDDLRASSWYGARKPDPLVFERVLESYGADAEDVFFADDLPENVEGARSVGITAHLYRDAAGLRTAIDAFLASHGRA